MLWRDECACDRAPTETAGASAGGALLLGACFALVLSPCCTPVVLAILAYTSASGSAMYGSALLACYALGHAMPLVAVAFGMQNVSAYLQRHFVQQAAAVVGGTLMLAVAGLYASLA